MLSISFSFTNTHLLLTKYLLFIYFGSYFRSNILSMHVYSEVNIRRKHQRRKAEKTQV